MFFSLNTMYAYTTTCRWSKNSRRTFFPLYENQNSLEIHKKNIKEILTLAGVNDLARSLHIENTQEIVRNWKPYEIFWVTY